MKVAVLRETRPGERRVALVPGAVSSLLDAGLEVTVETGAGVPASFPDARYREEGATVAPSPSKAVEGASVVLKVQPPDVGEDGSPAEVGSLSPGSALISFLSPATGPELLERLAHRDVTAFAMELMPRISRAQKMDALSSQATVAGYRATLLGANTLGRFLPMLMTAAGTIRPGRVLILGAGVAGLQAIATARRLGAEVEAFDIRPAVKEQVESLGARFLEAELEEDAEAEGGYARELSEEEHDRELQLIGRHITEADLVITTAQIPGREAPLLVTEEMVRSMRPGSVVVDLASESGGNCALTVADESVVRHDVHILGPVNLPSSLPVHASQMYARNITAFLLHLVTEGELELDFGDEITDATCVTHGGEVRHSRESEE